MYSPPIAETVHPVGNDKPQQPFDPKTRAGPSKPLEPRKPEEWLPLLEPTVQEDAAYPALTSAELERYSLSSNNACVPKVPIMRCCKGFCPSVTVQKTMQSWTCKIFCNAALAVEALSAIITQLQEWLLRAIRI